MQPDVPELCALIRVWHRRRVFAMDQRKRADLALGAFLRKELGWRKDAPPAERKAIADRAAILIDAAERDDASRVDPADWSEWGSFAQGSISARMPFARIEAEATRQMGRLAKQLPVWAAFAEPVKGLGACSLAVIVGEAGDLSLYDSEAKLWKRMGVAVTGAGDGLDDHRQGAPGAGATAADWIAEGYNKRRRSALFVIGHVLIKHSNPYREIYLRRRAYEVQRAEALGLVVAPAASIPKKNASAYRSAMHVHRRAQRYMEKRLLRHLWRAWRRATCGAPEMGHAHDAPSPIIDCDAP